MESVCRGRYAHSVPRGVPQHSAPLKKFVDGRRELLPSWRGVGGGGLMAGKRRRPAAEDGVPPFLQIPPHTHILLARLPAPYSPFPPRRAHSPTAFSGPMARPLLPSSDRSAGQRNQPSHSTVLARPVCLFVCVIAASFPCRFPDETTPIEATPLSATSTELGLGWGLALGLHSLSHSSSHALSFFSPPSFRTLSLSPAFTSVWWSA